MQRSQAYLTAPAGILLPFLVFRHIIEEGQTGIEFVDKDLISEIVNSVRNGYLNIEALDEAVICSAFASLVAREVASLLALSGRNQPFRATGRRKDQNNILMRSLEKTIAHSSLPFMNDKISYRKAAEGPPRASTLESQLTSASRQWAKVLKVFLKLYSVMSV